MKRIYILFCLLMMYSTIIAQYDYYWYKNQKILLEKNLKKKFILFENIVDTNELKNLLNIPYLRISTFQEEQSVLNPDPNKQQFMSNRKWAVIYADSPIPKVSINQNIIYEAPFYTTIHNEELGLSQLFYVKLLNEYDYNKLEKLTLENNVEILGNNTYMPLWYTLACTKYSKGNTLEMAAFFYETGLFNTSEPDLLVDNLAICVDDTYFNDEWGLDNTGQYSGISGIDINICQAWETSTGDQNIIIAILDQGIELNHPDLTNIYPHSWDTQTGTSPSQVRGEHATSVAGIVGATSDNNLGVAGVAPECRLMSISNSLLLYAGVIQHLADGLNHAWQNEADIISNSWGSNAITSTLIDDAIENALVHGRNGLGCTVVFSAGNDNLSVSYPANSNPSILAVGAISQCGERKYPSSCDGETNWGSNFGDELDIMGPGVLISTTDRQGTNGYNPNIPIHTMNGGTLVTSDYVDQDYTVWFNGTSAACPHVSGVAGLILSVNPCLTELQVANIIESTAQKIGGYTYQTTQGRLNGTWNNQMGYGLLDASAAVSQALSQNTIISDITFEEDIILTNCRNDIEMHNVNITNNANVVIESSNNIIIYGTFNTALGTTLQIN